jgi:hypothetical protein
LTQSDVIRWMRHPLNLVEQINQTWRRWPVLESGEIQAWSVDV